MSFKIIVSKSGSIFTFWLVQVQLCKNANLCPVYPWCDVYEQVGLPETEDIELLLYMVFDRTTMSSRCPLPSSHMPKWVSPLSPDC